MSIWRGFPVPPNPSWLRTHAEAGCAAHNHPLPHLPPLPPWLLRPGLVLLFFSETLPDFSLLHGCPFSLHFFPRLSLPPDLWEVGDVVATQHRSVEGLRRGVFLDRRSLMMAHIPLSPFGRAPLCPLRPAACRRAEGSGGDGGKQQRASLSPRQLLRPLVSFQNQHACCFCPVTPHVLACTGSGNNSFGQPQANFRLRQKPQA